MTNALAAFVLLLAMTQTASLVMLHQYEREAARLDRRVRMLEERDAEREQCTDRRRVDALRAMFVNEGLHLVASKVDIGLPWEEARHHIQVLDGATMLVNGVFDGSEADALEAALKQAQTVKAAAKAYADREKETS